MNHSNSLIVMALPQESRGLLEQAGATPLYTGVGKVNAASSLARALADLRCAGIPPALVANPGTAGSRSIRAHTLVACNRLSHGDMNVTGIGFPAGVTRFHEPPPVIQLPS